MLDNHPVENIKVVFVSSFMAKNVFRAVMLLLPKLVLDCFY